jgi:putative tryptophan/tyrosine transport system substrate-binding protein
MKRREFIAAVGGGLLWPLVTHAQPNRRLGILMVASAQSARAHGMLEAFVQGLKDYGWIDGQNVSLEYRFAEGKADLAARLASELVQLRVDAILADSSQATEAAKNATLTIPIVMAVSNDPVASGFVASLGRPGGNITGNSLLSPELAGRRLQLLTDIVPGLARVVVLANPSSPITALLLTQTQTAAQTLVVELQVVEAATPDNLEAAFAAITAAHAGALIVMQDVMFFNQHPRIVAFAAASHLPALFAEKEVVESGGLIAYGPSIPVSFRRAATYVDKIFRGANPADLPVEAPTIFELAVNLKTAKALGLTMPPAIVATADDVVE